LEKRGGLFFQEGGDSSGVLLQVFSCLASLRGWQTNLPFAYDAAGFDEKERAMKRYLMVETEAMMAADVTTKAATGAAYISDTASATQLLT
jgi:hypothetical protein